MDTLQRSLFPYLEECSGTPLTDKQKQLIQILEIVQVEKSVHKRAATQWMGRKIQEPVKIIKEQRLIANRFLKENIFCQLPN